MDMIRKQTLNRFRVTRHKGNVGQFLAYNAIRRYSNFEEAKY